MARIHGQRIWLDGRMIPWDEARVHVLTHTLHYGLGVFEGIRCYRHGRRALGRVPPARARAPPVRVRAHQPDVDPVLARDRHAGRVLTRCARTGSREGYIRPLVFIGDGVMGLNPADNPVRVAVIAWAWGKYLGEEGHGARHPLPRVELHAPPREREDDQGQDLRRLRELDPRQARGAARRLRRGDPARHHGPRVRGERREPVRGARRRDQDAAARERARGHHAQLGDRARARQGHARLRGADHARRALHRRRGVPDGHRGRGHAGARDRPPPDRRRPPRPASRRRCRTPSSTSSRAATASTSAGSPTCEPRVRRTASSVAIVAGEAPRAIASTKTTASSPSWTSLPSATATCW